MRQQPSVKNKKTAVWPQRNLMDEAGAVFHRALGGGGGFHRIKQSNKNQQQLHQTTQIRLVYDPDSGWITPNEEKVRRSLIEKASKPRQSDEHSISTTTTTTQTTATTSIKYNVFVLDAWILTLLSASIVIMGFFIWNLGDATSGGMQTRTALLLTYLYAFLTFFLSNGVILRRRHSNS